MSSGAFSKFTFRLIEPSFVTLPVEVKDDMKESSYEAAGLATYSSSESTAWTHFHFYKILDASMIT
jgi:hypothetical protein